MNTPKASLPVNSASAPNTLPIKIGEIIRSARMFAGFTQNELAQQLGITYQQLQKYESGRNTLSLLKFIHIANLCNLNAAELLEKMDRGGMEDSLSDAGSLSKLRLLRSFDKIKNPHIKSQVLQLIKELSNK